LRYYFIANTYACYKNARFPFQFSRDQYFESASFLQAIKKREQQEEQKTDDDETVEDVPDGKFNI
jgi:ABC-type transporter lipoprotein component MlaA